MGEIRTLGDILPIAASCQTNPPHTYEVHFVYKVPHLRGKEGPNEIFTRNVLKRLCRRSSLRSGFELIRMKAGVTLCAAWQVE